MVCCLKAMTILPLVERELRAQARSPSCYWLRFAAALGGILVCLPSLMMNGAPSLTPGQMGASAFNGIVLTAFILCCLSGLATVDGISRELREGTLGLLFLTRVRAADVLLGKFGAVGLTGLGALAACVPVLIVPILTGGVSGWEAARKVLALFDTMIMSLAAGLWGSARGRGWWTSACSAVLMLVLLVFGPLLLGAMFLGSAGPNVSWPGPLSAFMTAEDVNYRRSAGAYWLSIVVIHATSWLLLIGAGFRLRRVLKEDDEGFLRRVRPTASGKSSPGFTLATLETSSQRSKARAEGAAPLVWLMDRQQGIRKVVWAGAMLELIYHTGLLFWGAFFRNGWGVYAPMAVGAAINIVEGCFFAWAASRFFLESRRDGEFELLMTTPEGARNIVASQWKWLRKVFRWPTVVLVAPYVLICLTSYLGPYQVWRYAQLIFSLNVIAGVVALIRVGMWYGWSERSQARAVARTVVLAKVVSYLILTVGTLIITKILPAPFYSPFSNLRFLLVGFVPQLIILLYYICLYHWARRRLEARLGQNKPKSGLDSLLKFIYQPG
jgi:hypothetical protein